MHTPIFGLKKLLTLLMLVFFIGQVYAQRRTPWNLRRWDDRNYHFGFTIGFNSSNFNVDLKENAFADQSDSLIAINNLREPGFNLGIVTSLTIHPQLRLRFIPSLSFQDRTLQYRYQATEIQNQLVEKRVESTLVSFPLLLKYRTKRINNMAAYVIGGFKYGIDMASQKDVDNAKADEIVVKLNKYNYAAEIGGGFDFFLLYFKFGIELKTDFGLPDMLIQDNSRFSSPLEQLKTRTVFFSLTFEG